MGIKFVTSTVRREWNWTCIAFHVIFLFAICVPWSNTKITPSSQLPPRKNTWTKRCIAYFFVLFRTWKYQKSTMLGIPCRFLRWIYVLYYFHVKFKQKYFENGRRVDGFVSKMFSINLWNDLELKQQIIYNGWHCQGSHSDWKMGRHFPVRAKSGNFEDGKITQNTWKVIVLPDANEVCESHVFTGVCLSQHALGRGVSVCPSMHWAGGVCLGRGCLPGRGCGRHPPPRRIPRDAVNKWAVRISLECILATVRKQVAER